MNGLVPGRIVLVVISEMTAKSINELRQVSRTTDAAAAPIVACAHQGNDLEEGDIVPAVVTAVWGPETINVKAFLDGCDNAWITSISLDSGTEVPEDGATPAHLEYKPHTWHWMFEKQATRYTPGEAEIRAMLESVISGDNGVVRNIAREEAEKLAHRIGDHFEQAAKAQGVYVRAAAGADADLEALREGEVTYRSRVEKALQEAEDLVSRHQVEVAYAQLKRDLTRLLEEWPK